MGILESAVLHGAPCDPVWRSAGLGGDGTVYPLLVTGASGTHLLLPHPDGAGELTVGLFEPMACHAAQPFPLLGLWPPQDSPHERSLGPHSAPRSQTSIKVVVLPPGYLLHSPPFLNLPAQSSLPPQRVLC